MSRALRAAAAVVLVLAPTAGGIAGAGGPPPTPVPPAGSPSPYPQSLDTPRPARRPPDLDVAALALVDLDGRRILYGRNARARRPIASLTKVMTAVLVLGATEPDETVTASARAAAETGSELGLTPGERISVDDLLHGLLLQSSNDAAVALAEHVAGSVEAFVRQMNRRAGRLGLRDTRFASPNGLDDSGFSTARDLGILTAEAYEFPEFARIAATRRAMVPAPSGPPRRIQSRNALLWLYPDAVGVKTGYTSAAGFCLIGAADRDGRRLAAVVLGAPTAAFDETAALLDHGFFNWRRKVLVAEGESLDPPAPVLAEGVEVPVEAGDDIEALLRRGTPTRVEIEPDRGIILPVPGGSIVGTVVGFAGDRELGRVPLVAAETVHGPAPSEPPPPDILGEVGTEVWDLLTDLVDAIF